MKVILADDSELIISRIQDIMNKYKHVKLIGSYRNGTDALKAMKTLKPDLAILDIQMPGLTGLEVLREIRKENKTMKIMIVTLFSSGFYKSKAMKEGADYFLSKAEDFEKITTIIDEMLHDEQKNQTKASNPFKIIEIQKNN
jgi:two-component system, NarL family, response regulator DesR